MSKRRYEAETHSLRTSPHVSERSVVGARDMDLNAHDQVKGSGAGVHRGLLLTQQHSTRYDMTLLPNLTSCLATYTIYEMQVIDMWTSNYSNWNFIFSNISPVNYLPPPQHTMQPRSICYKKLVLYSTPFLKPIEISGSSLLAKTEKSSSIVSWYPIPIFPVFHGLFRKFSRNGSMRKVNAFCNGAFHNSVWHYRTLRNSV